MGLMQVADRVTVYTKSYEEEQQWVWESSVGSHQYTIKEDDTADKMVRGTRVVLHLKVCQAQRNMRDHYGGSTSLHA